MSYLTLKNQQGNIGVAADCGNGVLTLSVSPHPAVYEWLLRLSPGEAASVGRWLVEEAHRCKPDIIPQVVADLLDFAAEGQRDGG